ncbi:MAG: putative bifunctional diguanylate cyclase/phosphodiesterase [Methylovirgula sp.]
MLVALTFLVSSETKIFAHIFEFAKINRHWMLDDLLVALLVLSAALLIYGYRRNQELAREIKARRAAEREAHMLARHDSLTGLANRRRFREELHDTLRQLEIEGGRCAVLMLDLDGFKNINDVHGHAAGDQALVAFAARISLLIRPDTFLARLSGDEFALIQTDIPSLEAPTALARRIISALTEPITIDNTSVSLGVGVGIAIAPDDGIKHAEILRRADLALYRAKAEGRSMIRFFEVEMDKHVERRARIERDLRAGLAHRELTIAYQPIVQLDGQGIVGFEALARWTSVELGPIEPTVFIAVAEECGLIHELGDYLLRIACCEATRWPPNLTLSFNISPLQLRDATLGLRILAILGETGFNPRQLELEITESALLGDIGVTQTTIDQLRAAGVRIALDDFGTGYATMSQLLSLRFDKIKIDQSFVRRLGKDRQSDVIVSATIGLGKGLGLVTTAEGIEDADQLAQLQASGCIEGQGFLLGRPVPASEIVSFLTEARSASDPAGSSSRLRDLRRL